MGMSMNVSYFRSAQNAAMHKKLDAAYACQAAGLSMPVELQQFLKPVMDNYGELPEDRNCAVDCLLEVNGCSSQSEWDDGDMRNGFDIDLSKLPPGVTKIRFYCSW